MKVVIVDDSRAMRMIVQRSLRQAGYEAATVVEAENGLEALAKIENEEPDLVLSDWNMPEMNGIELLRELQARGFIIPFGFVTSESTEHMRQQAASAGAEFLLSKPFTPEDFKDVLSRVT